MQHPRLHDALAGALDARGYDKLTPVQAAVLAEEADGRDLLVSAQTGSGKTVAFGLAIASDLLGEAERLAVRRAPRSAWSSRRPASSRMQVSRELDWLYATAGARVVTCVGGMDPMKERRALAGGAHIVVGTPGRLRDHLERGALDLSALARRGARRGRRDARHGLPRGPRGDPRRHARPSAARLLFSATMPRPIARSPSATSATRCASRPSATSEAHGDIEYRAVRVAPNEIEHAVVNLLRFFEARDRDPVLRHPRGGPPAPRAACPSAVSPPSRCPASSPRRSATTRCRRCATGARASASPPTSPRAASTCRDLGLVIHADLPRDAEALLHRSGRTGRAGRKGTAVLIVPFQRRQRVEGMLRGARIAAEWIGVPSAAEIRAKDRQRLLATLSAGVELEEEDQDLVRDLMNELAPEAIAAALVKSLRSDLPAPEDIIPASQRSDRATEGGPREGFENATWFKLNAGRRHNADPRWLLPLICRYGHVNRTEVGAIRLAANESYFQISERATPGFRKALSRATIAPEDQGLMIELAEPREQAPAYRPERSHDRPRLKKKPRSPKAP